MIAVLSAAFFPQGMTGLGWAVISEIAPVSMMGLTGGIFNFAANLRRRSLIPLAGFGPVPRLLGRDSGGGLVQHFG
jgi:hypothetical protein